MVATLVTKQETEMIEKLTMNLDPAVPSSQRVPESVSCPSGTIGTGVATWGKQTSEV